jgi:hypothetical protein
MIFVVNENNEDISQYKMGKEICNDKSMSVGGI